MIFASNNKGKLNEIRKVFKNYDIKSLEDVGVDIDVIEDQDSFYGNALKKAKEISNLVNDDVIADDSGICIDYLNGMPGIYTKRLMGENATNDERNDYILEKMKDVPKEKRGVLVVCQLVYYSKEGKILSGKGIVKGYIATQKKGKNGFGFDCIVELENGKTFAELSIDEKNEISQRKLAAQDLLSKFN